MRFWLVLVAALLAAGSASAQPSSAKDAKAHYQAAMLHYNLNEFPQALAEFKDAYRLKPDSAFLFNIAQCYRQLGEYAQAASFYRNYRRESAEAANRRDVDRLIAEMDKAAAEARAKQPPTGTEPPHDTTATGRPATGGDTTTTDKTTAGDNVVAKGPAEKPLTKKAWFWGVVAGGAVVVATGVTLGIVLGVQRDPQLAYGSVAGN